jgi:RNA polymerase-binding transcription factor DksA
MTTMRHNDIRATLLSRRREVMARYYAALLRAEEEIANAETEDVERATEQWDVRVLSALSHADLQELVRLTEAIQRIDEGDYGTCTDCGASINSERLRVLPTTPTCVNCARASEARGVHEGEP